MSFFGTLRSVLGFGGLLVVSASAATHPQVNVQPQTRIVQKIDNATVTTLLHTSPTTIARAVDQGRVAADTQFNHMMLVLKSSEAQEFALHGLLDEQQDKGAANYHQWMTPETFGANFGVASSDLAKITAWLQDAGLTVESVTKGARIIAFSGTSGQVEAAFHTQMHRYTLDGEAHVANASDISIPTALVSVVAGVSSLNNFNLKQNLVNPRRAVLGEDGKMYPTLAGTVTPDYTSALSGNHFVGAGDLATIFDTKPLLAAGFDGTGQKIGVIGRTDILLSDVQIYRTIFGLPKNDPTFTQIGGDPATNGDDGESDLDVELAGAVAPMASVNFVTSADSYFGGGIDASGLYLVENNNVDIISLSYGGCEVNFGAGLNAFYNALWEQAAAQGQTVFVSSGDSGAATCDSSSAPFATHGYAVNALGSTPFNVSVGGTMFNDGSATGSTTFWGPAAGAPYSTALSYIPELPWNESALGTNALGGIVAAGSGISLYYQTPSYQTGPGVPTVDPIVSANAVVPGPHRYLPDVSLVAAAGHDATVYCSEGSCKLNEAGGVTSLGLVGGTSVATPVMASVQALINQKNGGRQGQANYYYYRIAAAQSLANCAASTLPSTAGAGCAFHDITAGNTNIPTNASGTTSIGFNAGPGYDLAVGLGSADVNNLANAWSTVSFNATRTSFTVTPTTGLTHGATQNVTINVTPVSGTGVPTGDVSIIANAAYGGAGFYTLSSGSVNGTLSGLPAGTYTVYAHYAGDATYGGSNSPGVSVTIAPETSTLSVSPYLLATNGALSSTSTFAYGSNVYLDANVAGTSQTGTPTGTVTFTLSSGTSNLPAMIAPLDSFANAYYDAGIGYAGYGIIGTTGVLAPGTYSVSAAYSGDTSFNASNKTPFSIVVGKASQALSLRAVTADVTSGGTATFNASIATLAAAAGGVPATGTVTFSEGGNPVGTGTLVNGAMVFTTNAFTVAGPHSVVATYSGDANYNPATSAATTVTVGGSASTLTLAASAASVQVGNAVTFTATAPAGSSGTVFFYENGASLGGANISTTTLTGAISVTSFRAGSHSVTATFSGNATTAASTSAAAVVNVTQNTPTLQLTAPQTIAANTTVSMNAVLTPTPADTKPSNPAPTGVIQFLDGTTVLGTATAAYLPGYQNYVASFTSPALKPGPHTFTASYVGDANYAAAASNAQANSIGLTTVTVSSSSTSVGVGTLFTLSARVASLVATPAPIGGTVMFLDGTTVIGTAPVTGGVGTLSTATLAGVGTHTITAVYAGDANYYTSTTGAAITITTVTPAVTLALNSSTLAIVQGQAGEVLATLTTAGNYSGTAALSCSGLPAGSTCSFSAPTLTFNGTNSSQTSAVIVSTATTKSSAFGSSSGWLWMVSVLLGGLVTFRRRQIPVRGRQMLMLAVLACGLMAVTGCGGTSAPTMSTVTVTATTTGSTAASPSGTVTSSLAVTVQ